MSVHQDPYRCEDGQYNWRWYKRKRDFLLKRGFVRIPDWMPWPVEGYKWQVVDGWDAMMKPAPLMIHRIRWQILPWFVPKFIKRWRTRRALDL